MNKLLMLIICLSLGIVRSVAVEEIKSVTYSIDANGNLTTNGGELEGSKAVFANTYGKSQQMTKEKTATLTLTNYDGYIIQGLTLNMRANKDKGKGTFSLKCGKNEIARISSATNTWYSTIPFTDTPRNVKVQFLTDDIYSRTVGKNETVTITISATENSLYIYSYTVAYQKNDAPMINPTKGDVFNRKQQIEIFCEDNVDNIYYTLDGTEPTTESFVYDESQPLYIDKTTTVKAVGVKNGEPTLTNTKTFEKNNNIKAIVAQYDNKYYYMSKEQANTSLGHLKGVYCDMKNDILLCSPKNLSKCAWIFNSNGTIQSYGSTTYLTFYDAVTKLGNSTKWNVSDNGIFSKDGDNARYLHYVNDKSYFGAYVPPTCKAYAYDVIKGNFRTGQEKGKWGTMCLPYDVLSDDRSGAVYYNIVGKKIENGKVVSIVLEEEQGTLKAGQPYLFEATDTEVSNMYLDIADVDNAAEYGKKNGLVGCSSETTVKSGMFIVNENKIVKCGTGCKVKGNRAYINMEDVPEISSHQTPAAKRAVEMKIDNRTTGMVDFYTGEMSDIYYNIQGQRVSSPKKGLYIVNGKKVIVK